MVQVRQERFAPARVEERHVPTHDRLFDAELQIRQALTQTQASVESFQQALDLIAELRSLIDRENCQTSAQAGSLVSICDWLDNDPHVCCTPALTSIPRRPHAPQGVGLSSREIEILALVAEGRSNKAIALQLFLSVRTVERHINNTYRKIGARNRAEATAFALRHFLI